MNIERDQEARMSRRMKAEDRFLERIARRELAAILMIGTLIRGGEEVYYVYPVGGRYREGTERQLIDFLTRNNYA